jgi:hypothetical protein
MCEEMEIDKMKEYLECECGSKKTYISVAGDTCCSPCFKPLAEKAIEKIDMTAGVFADDGGWSVKVNGVVKKYFSKYEDYALTEARNYARELNLA